MDKKCTEIIESTMAELVSHGYVEPTDVDQLADNLIYDERSNICFAYDPRDVMRRRLQFSDQDCNEMNCFDCAYTAGKCVYDNSINECVLPPVSLDGSGLRWWSYFEYCEDERGLCSTSADTVQKITGGDLSTALKDGNTVGFSIAAASELGFIPQNYFCRWDVNINSKAEY